jgi:TPR repeat protein
MNLGRMYLDGTGVPIDLVSAYEWFYVARQNGNAVADHYLRDLGGQNPMGPSGVLTDIQIQEAIRRANALKMSLAKKS